jgi:hypothetical protein
MMRDLIGRQHRLLAGADMVILPDATKPVKHLFPCLTTYFRNLAPNPFARQWKTLDIASGNW